MYTAQDKSCGTDYLQKRETDQAFEPDHHGRIDLQANQADNTA